MSARNKPDETDLKPTPDVDPVERQRLQKKADETAKDAIQARRLLERLKRDNAPHQVIGPVIDDYYAKEAKSERASLSFTCAEDYGGPVFVYRGLPGEEVQRQGSAVESRQPLPEGARMVFEKLRSLEPHVAMTLPAIQKWYEEETGKNLDEGTWKRWRPELEVFGMKNRPNVGYYIQQE